MLATALGRFRVVSLLEGLSYLVLVFFAMPLKYGWDDPSWVRLFGRLHGGLFVLFVFALYRAAAERGWTTRRSGEAFAWSLVPFGALVLEKQLAAEAAGEAAPPAN